MAKAKKDVVPAKMSFKEKVAELEAKAKRPEPSRIFIPTGSVGYNWALGGGYKTGRVYEKIAWEGCGKTTLALHAAAECQALGLNVGYIDAEHALDQSYASKIGVDWDSMGLFQPSNGEEGFEWAKDMMSTGDMSLLIIDSTSGMLPKKQMEDPAGSSNLGLHARLMGQEVPKLVHLADVHNCAIIFISQFREKIGVMFGCLHAETLVNFVDGRSIRIKDVVDNKIKGKVWSWNEKLNIFEQKEIIDWHFNGRIQNNSDFIHFETEGINTNNGRFGFTVTPTHKIYSNGWKEAKDLNVGDEILSKYESHFGEYGEEILKGCFVGDSCLHIRSNNTASLQFEDSVNPEYVEWKMSILPSLKFTKNGKRWQSEYTYEFAKWKKKIGKRNPVEVFESGISWLSLAIWIMDDGHFQKNHKRYSLSVKRFKNNREILENTGKLFRNIGLQFNITKAGTFVFTVGSSILIAEEIRKYIPKCMEYKLPEWAIIKNSGNVINIKSAKVIKDTNVKIILKRFASNKQMRNIGKYDISIQDNHNYMVGGINNGVIVHNSPETTQGGNALKFWASVRTEFRKELIKEGDDVSGITSRFKVIKNKVVSPYRTGRIPIRFGIGIEKKEEIIELATKFGVIKPWGKTITLVETDVKYDYNEFISELDDNETGLKSYLSNTISAKLNNTFENELVVDTDGSGS